MGKSAVLIVIAHPALNKDYRNIKDISGVGLISLITGIFASLAVNINPAFIVGSFAVHIIYNAISSFGITSFKPASLEGDEIKAKISLFEQAFGEDFDYTQIYEFIRYVDIETGKLKKILEENKDKKWFKELFSEEFVLKFF